MSFISDLIHYLDLHAETPEDRRSKTIEFYEQVYRDAFPDPDQAETPDIWLPLMAADSPDQSPAVYIIIACDSQDRIVGGAVLEQYPMSDCWLLTYIAVRPEVRRLGIARGLMAEVARAIAKHEQTDALLLAEAQNPMLAKTEAARIVAEQRLFALDALGLRHVLIDYAQPALAPDKHPLHDLLLLCYDPEQTCSGISAQRVAAFLAEFYTVYGQQDSDYLHGTLAILAQQDCIAIRQLPLKKEFLDINGGSVAIPDTVGSVRSIRKFPLLTYIFLACRQKINLALNSVWG